jgi:hypothetical protein
VTAHGKTKAYLHRIGTLDSPECPCGGTNQTVDHLLFNCTALQNQRDQLIGKISKQENWPVNKSKLVSDHIKHFLQFTNSIDFTIVCLYAPLLGVILHAYYKYNA